MRAWSAWLGRVNLAAGEAGRLKEQLLGAPFDDSASYVRELASVRACSETLRGRVGPAVSARTEVVRQLTFRACDELRRYADSEAAAVTGRVEGLAEGSESLDRATLLLADAYARLGVLLRANAPLQVRGGITGESRIEPLLGRIGSELVLTGEVEVRCWSESDWRVVVDEETAYTNGHVTIDNTGAFATYESLRANLQAADCLELVRLAYARRLPVDDEGRWRLAEAVGTYSHELQHLVANGSESETECAGIQQIARLARRLGAPARYARVLATTYWEEEYPSLPREYRNPNCRDGGLLDQHARVGVWP